MKINFSINYHTQPWRSLFVVGSIGQLGDWNLKNAEKMTCTDGISWKCEVEVAEKDLASLEYKYVMANEDASDPTWEFGDNRQLPANREECELIDLADEWKVKDNSYKVLHSSAFTNAIFKNNITEPKTKPEKKQKNSHLVTFNIYTPKIAPGHKVCILGQAKELGEWNYENSILMDEVNPFRWQVSLEIKKTKYPVAYKYGIYDPQTQKIITLEAGKDRTFDYSKAKESSVCRLDEVFNYTDLHWRGTGVAIPVFSLRSKTSMGVGEFNDIKLLVDWCNKVGINMIQLLPVNDTVSSHTWVDSYPYSGISVTALHPIYLNIDSLGKLPFGVTNEILKERAQVLNSCDCVDYEAVMKVKSRIYKMAYDVQKNNILKDQEFIKFLDKNKYWLEPYAAFSFLRDLYGTADFSQWGAYAEFDREVINKLVEPSTEHYDEIAIHYYIQYHLHKQLLDAADYARSKGVLLKGDIPIGVNRNGVDAWTHTNLFNMEYQTGAPPDDYAEDGQNWGFPTYNWEEMSKDNYKWWQDRLKHMSQYFDAYRIDHILGFFRIWEIPCDALSGLLGHFSPAHPIGKEEFVHRNIWFDENYYCNPGISREMVKNVFREQSENALRNYFDTEKDGKISLKPELRTQRLIEEYFKVTAEMTDLERTFRSETKKKLSKLLTNILLVKDKNLPDCYHPRIEIKKAESFQSLAWGDQERLYELYVDYYYKRQEHLWREQAMIKLPVLVNATDMLVCGEDLGMVPDCVPGVMDELAILSLRMQRMPKEEWLTFGIPAHYPYMSVCSPSCHDMSTIRGWWEEDRGKTQRYYNEILGHGGQAPFYCEPWIVEEILVDHLNSQSMWAVFPIQDLVGIDQHLRRSNPDDERINVPSIPKHYWRYRLHINIEDLLKENKFNNHLRDIIERSGRNVIYY